MIKIIRRSRSNSGIDGNRSLRRWSLCQRCYIPAFPARLLLVFGGFFGISDPRRLVRPFPLDECEFLTRIECQGNDIYRQSIQKLIIFVQLPLTVLYRCFDVFPTFSGSLII